MKFKTGVIMVFVLFIVGFVIKNTEIVNIKLWF